MLTNKQNPALTIIFALIIFLPVAAWAQNANTQSPQTNVSNPPSGIWTLDWSPDDKYIALGGDDSLVWLYDATSFGHRLEQDRRPDCNRYV